VEYLLVGLALTFGAVFLVLRIRRAFPDGFRAGDFVKVAIPRTADSPLAMGTRLDVAAALKKRGHAPADLRPLLDGRHDQELLDRYWKEMDMPQATVR
jgi:hypothetical protein